MIADSQLYTPRLTHSTTVILNYLARRPNELVTTEELRHVLYISKDTVRDYIWQIRRAKSVDIENVYGKGYILRTL